MTEQHRTDPRPNDRQLAAVLWQAASAAPLPEQFQSPSAVVHAALKRNKQMHWRVGSLTAAVLLFLLTAGLTAAAQGGLFSRADELEQEVQELVQVVQAAAEQHPPETVKTDPLALTAPIEPAIVLDGFGLRRPPFPGKARMHTGVDYAARQGQPVYAAAGGTVVVAESRPMLGNVVIISHGRVNGEMVSTWYAHNHELKVQVGQQVQQGEVIALAGSTGASTGPHLHFEVRVNGEPTDPGSWLNP